MLGITSLASGSAGNATLIEAENEAIIIDCGLSFKKLREKFSEINFDIDKLKAIFVTHEHGDHVAGIKTAGNSLKIPVYANMMTSNVIRAKNKAPEQFTIFENGCQIPVGSMIVEPFSVPHDGVDSVAYCIFNGEKKVAVATDFGFPSQMVKMKLQNCDALILEANYDEEMIKNVNRPWRTIQRIMGRHGHLSNDQSLEMLESVAKSEKLHTVIMGHVSRDSNTYELVEEICHKKLSEIDRTDITLKVARQDNITPTVWA